MPSEYRLHRRVQFYETDLAGFVHFSWFFRYMEEAEHALWREAGLTIADPGSDIAWPRLSASFDYHRPLRFEDEFEVCIRIVEMTNRTIRYSCVLQRDETTLATGSLTIICVSRSATPMRAVDIPAEIAGRLSVAAPTAACSASPL
jgi:YbgC/YbaW family acyl-CoA thioester hydrolase